MKEFNEIIRLLYRKYKKMVWGTLAAILLAGIVFFFSYFRVTGVEVMGSSYYSDEEIKDMALQGSFTDNSVLAVLLHSQVDVEDVPFVEGFSITRLNHNTLCISVREKKPVGCFSYLDSYIYFDREGFFIESSRTRDESIPYFSDIQVDNVVMNEKLPLKAADLLDTAVVLSSVFQKKNWAPDSISFDSSYQISLVCGDITVMLGKNQYLEDKLNRAIAILPKLSGEKGILHLENVTESSKTITFERAADEDGTLSASEELAYALAHWEGGYDQEGSYTGEGEYDKDLNYVGPKPTAESIAANGDWKGGYMEDGSYTGYGEFDRNGAYVGPKPEESSEDPDNSETDSYDESDYNESDYNESDYDELYYDDSNYDESYYDDSYYDDSNYDESYYDESYYDDSYYDESYYDDSYY